MNRVKKAAIGVVGVGLAAIGLNLQPKTPPKRVFLITGIDLQRGTVQGRLINADESPDSAVTLFKGFMSVDKDGAIETFRLRDINTKDRFTLSQVALETTEKSD